MTLKARLRVERPRFGLDLAFTAKPGEVVALLGPNGAGKSTALRVLAGLLPPASGHVELGAHVWDDPDRGIALPPERRPIGMVFQDYLLFPHLSALDNVAFGLRAQGIAKASARHLARGWLDRMGLADQVAKRPAQLSGGQAQRVALARALAVEPRLLLLDEPLAALDASTRLEVRMELGRHLAAYDGITVLVTHDAFDALILADRVIVVEDGAVTQDDAPSEVAHAPRTDYVARLVGLNFYRGRADGTLVHLRGGGELTIAQPMYGEVFVTFPPAAVALYPDRAAGSPRNCWPVTVNAVEERTDLIRIRLAGKPDVLADVTAAAVADLGLEPGRQLWATVKAAEVRAYPA